MTRVAVITPIWKRPHITRLVFDQWRTWSADGFTFEHVIVGSEGEESRALAGDFHYIEHENQPLGAKFNASVSYCKQLDFDYLMPMGSDQIVKDTIFAEYVPHIDAGRRYIGVQDLYVLDVKLPTVGYWPGYTNHRRGQPIGPGRMIRRDLVEELGWRLYADDLSKGLDGSMDSRVKCEALIHGRRHGMTSIKTEDSITKTNQHGGMRQRDRESFLAEFFPGMVIPTEGT